MAPIATTLLTRSRLALTQLGFGTASIGGLYRAAPPEAASVMEAAWDLGIRYFDTAPFYGSGLAEERLGAFLAGHRGEASVVSTKVGRLLEPVDPGQVPNTGYVGGLPNKVSFDYSYDGIMRSFDASCARLRGRVPDILYVHDIGARKHGTAANAVHYAALLDGGMRALQELKAGSGIKAIGLGVNEAQVCIDIITDGDIDIILLANRYTLLDHGTAGELMALCAARQIDVVIGGVFNSGILAAPDPKAGRFDYKQADAATIARVEALRAVCARRGTDLVTAALAFPLRAPAVRAILAGTAVVSELEDTIGRFGARLDDAFWAEIDAVVPAPSD